MSDSPNVNWWNDEAPKVFERGFLDRISSLGLFRCTSTNEYYNFGNDETGEAAWLVQPDKRTPYQALMISQQYKLEHTVIPRMIELKHPIQFDDDFLRFSRPQEFEGVQRDVHQAGESFAETINRAYSKFLSWQRRRMA